MFAESFPINGCLCWLHNSGFQHKLLINSMELKPSSEAAIRSATQYFMEPEGSLPCSQELRQYDDNSNQQVL
jgi:hypothetical protein